MKRTIKVTQDHIDRGGIQNCERCPIALALQDAFPDADSVYVDGDYMEVHYPDKPDLEACCPQAARDFIIRFDEPDEYAAWSPQPFEFEAEFRSCEDACCEAIDE